MKFEFTGIDEYVAQLNELAEKSEGLIKRAVYDGAAEVAKAVKEEIEGLPETEDRFYPPYQMPITGITAKQKQGLIDGLGLAKMQNENGYINTHVGFDGYNEEQTKKYPGGQPNAMIARAVNSGSSVRKKIPFMSRALKKAKEKAMSAMAARLDADIAAIKDD